MWFLYITCHAWKKTMPKHFFVVFNILMNGTIINTVFWAVESCMLLDMYQLFRWVPLCCFVLMLEAAHCSAVSVFARLHSVLSQKTYLFTYLLTYFLTYSMEQSPSEEANRFSASQEIPCILWNLKVHYRSHKCLPPLPFLSQLDPVHTPTSHFLKSHFNIILPSMSGSPKWSLSFRFPHQNPVYASPLPHTCCMPCPSYSSRFGHPNNTGWGVQIIKLLIM